jgi:DNA-binding NarL/FixJ family response regulator
MLTSLRRLLSLDCDVVGTVSDGGALLESAARLQPDVVVADLFMPIVDGLEACRQLTRLHPSVKVVLLSGMDDADMIEHAHAAGAAAFIVKYLLVPADLAATVRRVCGESEGPA